MTPRAFLTIHATTPPASHNDVGSMHIIKINPMNLYKISLNFSFLEVVAKFIVDEFGKQNLQPRLKVILPNNFACTELKKTLTIDYQITTLPTIIPFTAIIADRKNTSEDYEPIAPLEEKLFLAEIIINYDKLQFSVSEALKSAELLSKLFNELISNNISIKSIETYNNSKYWQTIYKFLEYGFDGWQTKIKELGKQSRAAYKLAILQEEITKIKNSNKEVIIAGLFAKDPMSKKFLQELAPIPSVSIINPEASFPAPATSPDNIYYAEPLNIYEEAQQIALICKQHIDKKIAIIVNNQQAKEIYANSLLKYSLKFEDLLGNDLATTNISHLLVTVSKILCNNFDLKTLFLLLKNPLINSLEIQKLEILLSNKNRFISSPKYLLLIIEATEDEELIVYCRELISILFEAKAYTIQDILKTTSEVAEKLYPNIREEEGGKEILEFLANLTNFSRYITLESKQDFPKVFASLISSVRYSNNNDTANIIIGCAEDLALSKFELVILPNFTGENWPPPVPIHPWLSKEARKQLEINYDETSTTLSLYHFYLFLHNKQVIILRSKKQDGKSTTPSNFLLKLQLILGDSIKKPDAVAGSRNDKLFRLSEDTGAYSNSFPDILSVTDIEILIRNPYSFYAKKILNLRKKDMIWEEPKISDFGNFIHKVLEKYSKNYDPQNYDQYVDSNIKQQLLINIGNNILQNTALPVYTKKTWQIKLLPLAKAFIAFDDEQRKNCKNIYFELKGELRLNIAGHNLKIIGIADRIEINKLNQVTILDYKTGAIPSKKEIDSGLSPQLIIESLMILENGFAITPNINHNITIAYVKISSSEPYLQLTEIKLSKEDLSRHKQGLISLLEHYITNKFFPYNVDLLKYNDYLHLRR